MVYQCKYCHKIFKTETGFKKHKCKLMERAEKSLPMAFYLYKIFLNVSHTKINKDEQIVFNKFLKNSQICDNFNKLAQFALEVDVINVVEYIKFMVDNRIPLTLWTTTVKYHKFMEWYIYNEPELSANTRSKMFIEQAKIDLNNLSQYQLFSHLYYGRISNKYLKSIGYDYKSKLDSGQIKELGVLA